MPYRVAPPREAPPLLEQWLEAWPRALAVWSRFVQMSEPRFCLTAEDEKREQLAGSFAMIRLADHAVVISLRQVEERGLGRFGLEILAHEIGHHVYVPGDPSDNARCLARMRALLPTKEHLAPMVANLYADLLVNDRLERLARVDIAAVFRVLAEADGASAGGGTPGKAPRPRREGASRGKLWTFYMRVYELLWMLERGSLAGAPIDGKTSYDAQLGARLVRAYAKDWLDGAGRFACLCLPYLMDDDVERTRSSLGPWLDATAAGAGSLPDGLAEIDEAELGGAVHPALDPELSGVALDGDLEGSGESRGRTPSVPSGRKTLERYREPFEYAEILRATGVTLDDRAIAARYYRERAVPHLVRFPVREAPHAADPMPEGLDIWDVGTPLEELDLLGTLLASPTVVPGVTTRKRLFGDSPGTTPERAPVDLYLGIDCSGSMSDPSRCMSYPVLAGAVLALSALRAGARVMVALSGEPGKTVTTDGFVRDERSVLEVLTDYLGTGYAFGIHRLAETFAAWSPAARAVHIVVVSDTDVFSMLEQKAGGALGWDVAREAARRCRGGATYVLQFPDAYLSQELGKAMVHPGLARMQADGWNVARVATMQQLVDFARRFSQASYGQAARAARR